MSCAFSFTNTANLETAVTPTDLKPVTVYAKSEDEPTRVVLKNKTCALDQGEVLTFMCKEVDKVSTSQHIQNPTKVPNGVQYVVKLEEILRSTDADGTVISDEPIVMYLTVRHQLTSNISDEIIGTVFKRLIGACYREDGTLRFNDLMRSALVPVVD